MILIRWKEKTMKWKNARNAAEMRKFFQKLLPCLRHVDEFHESLWRSPSPIIILVHQARSQRGEGQRPQAKSLPPPPWNIFKCYERGKGSQFCLILSPKIWFCCGYGPVVYALKCHWRFLEFFKRFILVRQYFYLKNRTFSPLIMWHNLRKCHKWFFYSF